MLQKNIKHTHTHTHIHTHTHKLTQHGKHKKNSFFFDSNTLLIQREHKKGFKTTVTMTLFQ